MIDSSRDLAISTNATRAEYGLPPLSQEVINSYVGNGAATLVKRAMGSGFSDEQGAEALGFFLRYYRAHSLEHTRLYEGVRETIADLATAHKLAALTNKPQKISFDILGALGVQQYFFRTVGGDTLPEKKPGPAGIFALMHEAHTEKTATCMIGDSHVDVETARRAGVSSCGVLWGLQPASLRETAPDYTIERPDELIEVVNGLSKTIVR